jgi:hypothetical protein
MTTERGTVILDLDDRGLQEKLKATKAEVYTLGGALDGVDTSSKKTAKALQLLGPVLGQMGGGATDAARAIGDLGTVLSAGWKGLGVTAVLGAVSYAANQLYDAWVEAAAGAKIFGDGVRSMTADINDRTVARIDQLAASVREAQVAFKNANKTSLQITKEAAQEEEARLSKAAAGQGARLDKLQEAKVEEERRLAVLSRSPLERDQAKIRESNGDGGLLNDLSKQIDAAKSRTELLNKELARTRSLLTTANEIQEPPEKPQTSKRAPKASTFASAEPAWRAKRREEIEWQIKQDEAFAARRRDDAAEQLDVAIFLSEEKRDREAELQKQREANIQKEKELALDAVKEETELRRAAIEGTAQIGVSTLQSYLEMKITGEKHAEELAVAGALREGGTALIGVGLRQLAEGGAMLLMGQPQGAGVAAIGAGAIALGVTMGGVGVGVTHSAAGGTIGQSLTDERPKTSREKGVNGMRRGSGGSGDGPAQIVYSFEYGVVGPTAEDQARELARRNDFGRRRGFTP